MPSGPHRRTPSWAQLTHDSALSGDIARIPARILTCIKQELGLSDKTLQELTVLEKTRIVASHFARNSRPVHTVDHPLQYQSEPGAMEQDFSDWFNPNDLDMH